jgi:hypothetical protein
VDFEVNYTTSLMMRLWFPPAKESVDLREEPRRASAGHRARPRQAGGLRAVDYFLWALQRFYEGAPDSSDDRYWEFVRSKAVLIYDIDDTRANSYGRFYTRKQPLTRATRGA